MMSEKTNLQFPSLSTSPAVSHDEDIIANGGPSNSDTLPYSEHGAGIDHQITQKQAIQQGRQLLWSRIRHTLRDPFSEFFGCFILILFGDGVVAQVRIIGNLSKPAVDHPQVVLSDGAKGAYQSISWGWGWVSAVTPMCFTKLQQNRSYVRCICIRGTFVSIYSAFYTYTIL
jgi:aquaglyceroporin related protein